MATSKNTIKSFTIKVNTDNGKIKIEGVTKAYESQEVAFKRLQGTVTSGAGAMTKANQHLSDATGSASASTLELGRVISDSNYGIRGVANNLSQLGTNLASTYKKAGSLKGAFTALKGALLGPLGALLLFQTFIALLERWSLKSKKATDSMKEFNAAGAKAGADLKIFKNQVEQGNVSRDEMEKSLVAINEKYKDLNIEIDDNGQLTDASTAAISRKINKLEDLARAAALQTVIEKQLAEQYEAEIELMDAQVERRRKYSDAEVLAAEEQARANQLKALSTRSLSQSIAMGSTADSGLSGRQEDAYDSTKDERIVETRLRKSKVRIQEIMNMFGDQDLIDELFPVKENGDSRTRNKRIKIFKQSLLDFDKLILQNNRNTEMVGVRHEETKQKIQQRFAREEINRKTTEFKEKQDKRLVDYLDQIKGMANFNELKLAAETKHADSIVLADVERWKALDSNAAVWTAKIGETRRKEQENVDRLLADSTRDTVDSLRGNDARDNSLDGMDSFANDQKRDEITSRLEIETEGSFAYMQIQQEQHDFEAQLNMEKIQREQDVIDRRKAVAMEYVGFVGQIGGLLTKLAGDNEKMQKLSLAVDKGAKIAGVIINAQASIAARTAAYGAIPSHIVTPFGGLTVPNPAKAADLVMSQKDKGRTKIGAALSIANILAQRVGSQSGVKGVGGGGGSKGRTFDFNLVGSTGQNQAAQATAGALGQPIQAYVVSSDITSQQQLDNNIQGQASFGEDDD